MARNISKIELTNNIKVGDRFIDIDVRNTDRGKTGKAKPKHREVEIVALPSLSSQGVMKVVKAPKAPHTIGKLRRFTFAKLVTNYVPASAVK
ncbi:hypothetical protein SEA_MERCEDES_55 [Microbacterium phage Mercedes]|nr:hypothetical protein SEA_MERCEDES_55 [Microbacterium phage Mercedes]